MKRKTKEFIGVVLVLVLLAGAMAFVFTSSSSETKNISLSFSKGGLDSSTGKPIEGKTTLYTKELFECQGLTIQPNYNYHCSFEVYYYREDKSFIGKTSAFNDSYEKGASFDNAKYARLLLIPPLEEGKDNIQFWEILQFSTDITVSVSTKQNFVAPVVSLNEDVYSAFCEELDRVVYCASVVDNGPFVMTEYKYPSAGSTVKEISIPAVGVLDYTKDSIFTVSVVKKNTSGKYVVVSTHELVIPAYTFKSNMESPVIGENQIFDFDPDSFEFYSFDVNIKLEAGESLAFSSASDSVFWAYRKATTISNGTNTASTVGFDNTTHEKYVFGSNLSATTSSELRAYFDVKYLK